MACPKIVLTMLILGSVMVLGTDSRAQADAAGPIRLAQAPTPPAPPAAPPSPPAANQSAAPTSPQPPDPVGSVATLQGTASVTRNNATTALALRDPVYKSDVLQTNVDGTLGITFDDETTFTLKPNTRLTVDEFVYQEGGTDNAAIFNVVRGTAAFVAAEVAHTGNMKIDTPTSSLGIRGTTGLVEVPEDGTAGGQVSIKLYPDADGRVGRIEVFGRDGAQLGILSRGATGFAVRPGAGGRFTAAPLQISALEAERDRSFVRQTFAARTVGRQIIQQRRTLQQQQRNQLRPNQPNPQRPGQLPGREQRPGLQQQRPELRTVPGGQPLPSPGQRPPYNNNPAHGLRSSNPARPQRHNNSSRAQDLRSSSQAWRRSAVDRMRRHCSSSPARRRRRNSRLAHGRPCISNPVRCHQVVDRMRRRCSNNLALGRPCNGSPERCRARNARPPDRASRRKRTKAVSADR